MTATSFSCIHQTAAIPGFWIPVLSITIITLLLPWELIAPTSMIPNLTHCLPPMHLHKVLHGILQVSLKGLLQVDGGYFPEFFPDTTDAPSSITKTSQNETNPPPSSRSKPQSSSSSKPQPSSSSKPQPSSSSKPLPSSSSKPQSSSSKPPPSSTHPEMAYLLPQLQNPITVVLKVLPLLFSQSALVFKVWFLGLCCISSTLTTSQGFLCLQAHCHSMLMTCYSITLSPLGLTLTLCRRTSSTFPPGLQTITWI